MDRQIRVLTEQEIRQMLKAVCTHGRPAFIDWVNRTIEVLSDEKGRYITHAPRWSPDIPRKTLVSE